MKVLLGGEGRTDIGEWANDGPYRADPPKSGVVGALLAKSVPKSTVADGVVWKSIRKYRSKDPPPAETRNVLALALRAFEEGHDAVVFARDRDRDATREADIDDGLARCRAEFPAVIVAGGIATEAIEAWLLALKGESKSEQRPDPKSHLAQSHGIKTTDAKVDVVMNAVLSKIPPDAVSLLRWLERVGKLNQP